MADEEPYPRLRRCRGHTDPTTCPFYRAPKYPVFGVCEKPLQPGKTACAEHAAIQAELEKAVREAEAAKEKAKQNAQAKTKQKSGR